MVKVNKRPTGLGLKKVMKCCMDVYSVVLLQSLDDFGFLRT